MASKAPEGLAARLKMRYGLGDFPLIRMRLFARLEALAVVNDQAYRIISECGIAATEKRNPGNWFAASVTRRLAEAGFPCSEVTRSHLEAKDEMMRAMAERFRVPPETEATR